MYKARKEAMRLLESGAARELLDRYLPIQNDAFESAAGRGDVDALVVLCQIRTHAPERFVGPHGQPLHDFARAELPYKIFCRAAEEGHADVLQWMLDHNRALNMRIRGVDAFMRAARKGRSDVLRWMLRNRAELASDRLDCIGTYCALRELIRGRHADDALWFMRNRIAITGHRFLPEEMLISFSSDPMLLALLFREGLARPNSVAIMAALRDSVHVEALVFHSCRVYDIILESCRADAPLPIELMLSRPTEIRAEHMLYKSELLAHESEMGWLADALRDHHDTFVEVGHVRRELEVRYVSPQTAQRTQELVKQLAWDPKPIMGTLVLMLAASCAHTFGSKNVQAVIDRACANTCVPDWVEKMVDDSHVGVRKMLPYRR
jgi:hypothetical protein